MAAEPSSDAQQVRIPQWTVGDRLRKAREEAGIGVEEISIMLGRNRNSVTRYERSRTVDVNVVRSYSMLTSTPMEWLLTGLGPEDPNGGDVSAPVTLRELPGNWSREFDQIEPRSLLKLVA